MTRATTYPRGARLAAAVLAGLLLAGCSSGHVGESWQCPLADAGTCDSVAAADPAVPDANAAGNTVLGEPLWRVRGGETVAAPPVSDASCEAACDGGFDPFAWLARLFGVDENDSGKAGRAPQPLVPNRSTVAAPAAVSPTDTLPAEPLPAEPGSAVLPAEPVAPEIHPGAEDPQGADLRTDEVVARIWIAPFVDADGVYREASWVRVVLEPAGWRLGR